MRSNASSSSISALLSMNAWRMTGMQARLVLPSVVALTGTLRQPKNRCPCSRTMASKAASAAVRRLSSRLKNSMPTPYRPGAGSVIPIRWHSLSRKACGSWVRMPAPSPVSGSAPAPPRCSRLHRMSRAWVTILCERLPAMSTIMPMPQASCSKAGEYSPR